ncbi:uncharacterized protein LOC105701733 isoform X1 [Orussus abietinus]|uniref:uncharacterized protein LOC105701733 isoform X1 n=1 Tax=Orussus abietinus TaxID=222816 RepID=UPI0006268418|nr:uncharacterized protein LOC105701733 isoform X1 [Orussus abietinus]
MPDSEAVYQPTTVGYSYDTSGDGTRERSRLGAGFLNIMSRHKISASKWCEWVLLSVTLAALLTGFVTMMIFLTSSGEARPANATLVNDGGQGSDSEKPGTIEMEGRSTGVGSMTVAKTMFLVAVLTGAGWAWLRFFRRRKSQRGGMSGGGGQMLGGLNPSTDLLVGSASQYGPVLTELPSQPKQKQPDDANETPAAPLSDQEEETRTLMQDNTMPALAPGAPKTTDQIPG